MRHPTRPLGALAAVLAVLSWGCGRSDRPPMAKVSGTITYKGKPLPEASISFLPEADGVRSAMGKTDAEGRYTLWTYENGDGAAVGKHRVTVALHGPPEKPKLNPAVAAKMGEAYYDQLSALGKPLIPAKYFGPETSGLTADVVKGKNNVFDFELTGEPPK